MHDRRLKVIYDVTEYLEERTAEQVLKELRSLLNKLTIQHPIGTDIKRFMQRLGENNVKKR